MVENWRADQRYLNCQRPSAPTPRLQRQSVPAHETRGRTAYTV